jgi:DNA-binding CsgD family transcriptional regulator
MRDDDFSELVGLTYVGALDPEIWPVMLNRLADILSATGAEIGSHNSSTKTTRMIAPRTDPEYLHSFTEYWIARKMIWQGGAKLPVGTVMIREMVIPRDKFCCTDHYNEWCKPQGVEETLAANLLIDGPILAVLAAHRPYAKGDFDTAETRLFAALIPHVRRAVQLQLRLAGLDGPPEGSAELLNRLTVGVMLVDGEARVIFANRAAEHMLQAGRGLCVGRDGLRAEIPAEARRLRRLIADCAQPGRELGGAGGRLRISREHGVPLIVLVVPHRARFTWLDVIRPRAILFITDPEATVVVRRQNLRDNFGLTSAEAAIAVEVLETDGLQAAAGRLGISLATARTHLAHVFDKTGTRHQAELVRLLLQSQPAIREDLTPHIRSELHPLGQRAVDDQIGAGDKAGTRARQKNDGVRHLGGCAHAAHRVARQH